MEQILTQHEADLLTPAMHDSEQFILSLDFETDTEIVHALQKIMPDVDFELLQEHLQLMRTFESEVYSHIQIAE